ncbi:hypothetical protein [Allostreptomyces psammosilenae]|uniref:Lipoprotein n=1 Tax=Allostreptomyces psammosilenae TaxID=1892865 RepID=A0A852ZR70_9ACTN|nr:hypothetical protein [Allostreptomyces psammosilenae]NYI04893.1 hypothetical protein [Allostreptomyces psammosilenae]
MRLRWVTLMAGCVVAMSGCYQVDDAPGGPGPAPGGDEPTATDASVPAGAASPTPQGEVTRQEGTAHVELMTVPDRASAAPGEEGGGPVAHETAGPSSSGAGAPAGPSAPRSGPATAGGGQGSADHDREEQRPAAPPQSPAKPPPTPRPPTAQRPSASSGGGAAPAPTPGPAPQVDPEELCAWGEAVGMWDPNAPMASTCRDGMRAGMG